MLLKMLRLIAVPLVFMHAGSAFALIDVEALAGKRWYQLGVDPKQNVSPWAYPVMLRREERAESKHLLLLT